MSHAGSDQEVDNDTMSNQAADLASQLLHQNNGPVDGNSADAAAYVYMLGNLREDGELPDTLEADEDIVNALADIEKSEELGPAVGTLLADAYNKTMTRPLSKENKDKLKLGLKIPENCSTFRVPKMNPDVWNRLPQRARMADLKYQQLQQTLSLGMTVLVKMSNEISLKAAEIPKETLTKVFKIGLDGANVMGNQMQELNQKRKSEVKPYLNADVAEICNAKIPPSEYLFGSNLAESLKSTKTASAMMKNTMHSRPYNRFHPYPSQRGSSLNFSRPFTPQRGWMSGPQSRSNPSRPFFNNQRFQNPHRQQYNKFTPRNQTK